MDAIHNFDRALAVAEVLRSLRVEAGLTQDDVAWRIGTPQSLVSKLEHGQRRLKLDEAWAYADALGIEPATLFAAISDAFADATAAGDAAEES